MAERSRGGGIGWFFVGVLAGVALTLGALAAYNLKSHRSRYDARSGADDAAASAAAQAAQTPAPGAAPAAPEVKAPVAPPPAAATAPSAHSGADDAAQAAQDAQMQDDAAATGMTSKARPPQ